ncbi:MAG: hypothetical protein AB1689_27725 [Thermodesulfobacteriota bacterium]
MLSASVIGLVLCATATVVAVVWMVAYRVGFNEGRLTIPLRLIHALADHKLRCLGEHPDKVARELVRVLALPERDSRRLISSKLRSPAPPAARSLRSA